MITAVYLFNSALTSIILVNAPAAMEEHANKTPSSILAANKKYYEANKEKIAARQRARRMDNKELIRAKEASYRKRIKEEMKLRKHAFYEKNKEKILAYAKMYGDLNRAEKKTYNQFYMRSKKGRAIRRAIESARSARKKGASIIGNLATIREWIFSWRKKKRVRCYWCDQYFNGVLCHVDHITPLSKGGAHSIENLCISCARCNQAKHAKNLDDWNQSLIQPKLF